MFYNRTDSEIKFTMKKRNAFTLVEILIVALIIGMLVTIAVPNFVRARENARAKTCAQNLRVIEVAKDQYLMDNNLPRAALIGIVDIAGTSSYIKIMPVCPSSGTYDVGRGDQEAICSIGVPHSLSGN
jgi:prepilin-type N-terminal cleavage/methylation domain-containing protein